MKHTLPFFLLASSFLLLSSCSPSTPAPTPQPIVVQYTAATTPWLAELYDCAGNEIVEVKFRSADFLDLRSADLVLRLGQPSSLITPAYQIGREDILVVVNRENPLPTLTLEQVHGLFTGQIVNWKDINGIDASVQVWTFSPGEDVQQIFDQTVLDGSPITSAARLAAGPEEMAQAVAEDVNAVGLQTSSWKTDDIPEVLTVTTAPVLAVTPSQPSAALNDILACMQSEVE